ncbi:prolipoprotein diacylglyceryl transferase [Thermotalea metallivorans]|uniref:Phosphatidylglycerol--prolipoprotein diacylglyceryl transferase n=1 Tax=Thermotalea metallivorans TaxID=520762 RepID=A0A140KZN2_9FIRM|nr:prolipoprotein diacylglyceryl transferase [Thermotalea metallivorans]KXG73757.1 Prolipoprotein diacylglyceryl transferase [Thermotalea metallivorans]
MKELFKIGHFGIYIFGVTIVAGMLAGLLIMMREAKRKGMDKNKMLDLATYTIIVSIIGARAYYILAFDFPYYLKNPIEIFYIRNGGLSIQGGLIAGVLFALWYTKKNKIFFWKAADAFAPGIIMGQAIGRIGCDVFGIPMERIYPWGVKINNQILHPVQIYEMLLNLILFTYLWRSRGKLKYNGELFIKYIMGFSMNRAIVEFFRSNPMVIQPFTIAHVTSLFIIIAAFLGGRSIREKQRVANEIPSNDYVKVSIFEYMLIFGIGAVGTLIYYSLY